MGYLLTAVGFVILAAVQAGLGSVWRPFGVKPDLVLTGLIVAGVAAGPRRALWAALAGGLALDLVSVLPAGSQVLALGLAAPLTALRARVGDTSSIVPALALTPVATVIANSAQVMEIALLGRPVLWGPWLEQIIIPLTIVNTLLVPVFWLPLGLFRRRQPRFVLQR